MRGDDREVVGDVVDGVDTEGELGALTVVGAVFGGGLVTRVGGVRGVAAVTSASGAAVVVGVGAFALLLNSEWVQPVS